MSYRLTKKAEAQRHRIEAMRRGKIAARMERPIEERAPELPALRRRIVIEDWDFGHRKCHGDYALVFGGAALFRVPNHQSVHVVHR